MAPPIDRGRKVSQSETPDPRTIWRALGVLGRLPHEALADLTERLVDHLDAAEPDPDLEPETDACEAGECGGVALHNDCLPGDPVDAEPADEDGGALEDEPCFPVEREARRVTVVKIKNGVRVPADVIWQQFR